MALLGIVLLPLLGALSAPDVWPRAQTVSALHRAAANAVESGLASSAPCAPGEEQAGRIVVATSCETGDGLETWMVTATRATASGAPPPDTVRFRASRRLL